MTYLPDSLAREVRGDYPTMRPQTYGDGRGDFGNCWRCPVTRLHRPLPGDWDWSGPVLAIVVLCGLRIWSGL
jgi:hypothetical protein